MPVTPTQTWPFPITLESGRAQRGTSSWRQQWWPSGGWQPGLLGEGQRQGCVPQGGVARLGHAILSRAQGSGLCSGSCWGRWGCRVGGQWCLGVVGPHLQPSLRPQVVRTGGPSTRGQRPAAGGIPCPPRPQQGRGGPWVQAPPTHWAWGTEQRAFLSLPGLSVSRALCGLPFPACTLSRCVGQGGMAELMEGLQLPPPV